MVVMVFLPSVLALRQVRRNIQPAPRRSRSGYSRSEQQTKHNGANAQSLRHKRSIETLRRPKGQHPVPGGRHHGEKPGRADQCPGADQRSDDMTPEQVTYVQDSFAKVQPIAGQAADMFYDRLFEIAPEVRALFPGDLT